MNRVEWRLAWPIHKETYYYISEIDDDELKEVPGIGKTLHTYKEYYYNFCLSANVLVDKCKNIISTQTKTQFQFNHGWSIYFDYFLMRSFGKSIQTAQQNVSVNYGISYEDCEHVFNLLLNTKEISQEVTGIKNQWSEINNIMDRLVVEISKTNTQ
jgi:hypothetical protein